jgi:enamine deaminase RidA (YjgF/YER057c/UK114 family)
MSLDPTEQDHEEHGRKSAVGRRALLTFAAAGAALAATPAAAAAAAAPAERQVGDKAAAGSPPEAAAAHHPGHQRIEHFTEIPGIFPLPNLSIAVAGTGKMIALTGQLPLDATGKLVSSDPLAQARQVFANITTVLRALGAGPRNVLRLDVFVIDLADVGAVRTANSEFIDPQNPPAATLVQVAGLVQPGVRLQIDVLAVV